jgi:hypothetical protein
LRARSRKLCGGGIRKMQLCPSQLHSKPMMMHGVFFFHSRHDEAANAVARFVSGATAD